MALKDVKQLVTNIGKTIQLNVQTLQLRIKGVRTSYAELNQAIANLEATLPFLQQTSRELQKEVDKMNFKNKPHLDRINEAQVRIENELNTLKQMTSLKKKKN